IHLVTGGGGAGLYSIRENEIWYSKSARVNHFIHFRVHGNLLQAKVVDLNGKIIDTFEIDKSKSQPDAVAYELIELDRILKELKFADQTGSTKTPVFIETNQSSGTVKCKLTNTLREPISVTTKFDNTGGIIFKPQIKITKVPPAESVTVTYPFEIAAPENIYPPKTPQLNVETALGKLTVRPSTPKIALRRTITANKTANPVKIDGLANEPDFKSATPNNGFLDRNLNKQDPKTLTTIKTLHDNNNLYLHVSRKIDIDAPPLIGLRKRKPDSILVYLFRNETKPPELTCSIDIHGKINYIKRSGQHIKAAIHKAEDRLAWEIAIPLSGFINAQTKPEKRLLFNVIERRELE
ncbi:MAG: hypothetical protein ACYTF1_27915, partial [Planctomycetota bacterium]